uniref:Uncharacterized protein n=1 Tax=Cacopsylla melanoneura TaxID=428564 RepID=A0A8D8VZM8_9HEMI
MFIEIVTKVIEETMLRMLTEMSTDPLKTSKETRLAPRINMITAIFETFLMIFLHKIVGPLELNNKMYPYGILEAKLEPFIHWKELIGQDVLISRLICMSLMAVIPCSCCPHPLQHYRSI